MKKCITIGVVVYLAITFLVPPLFAQSQYSYRFEKFLELIDYYYLQPNNLSREQMKSYQWSGLIADAFIQQKKYNNNNAGILYREFEKDLYNFFDDPNTVLSMFGFITSPREDIEEVSAQGLRSDLLGIGKNYRTEGDRMPSFEQWASDGYPSFEIEVRPLPPPKPIEEKLPVQGKKAVRDDEKAIKLLEEEGESTEDLSIDNDYWPAAPDPESAPDFDEFQ